MNRSLLLPCAALFLPLAGCGGEPKETWAMAEDSAPVFDGGDISAFVQGRWAVIEMMMGDEEPNWIEFGADGRFLYNMGGVEAGGAWKTGGQGIELTYDKLNGEPIQQKMDEIRKNSERGLPSDVMNDLILDNVQTAMSKHNQVSLGEDGRSLAFGPPPRAETDGSLEDIMSSMGGPSLERMTNRTG